MTRLGELVAENHTMSVMGGRTLLAQLRAAMPNSVRPVFTKKRIRRRVLDRKTVSSRAMTVDGGTSYVPRREGKSQ
jgi:hypothetical protein